MYTRLRNGTRLNAESLEDRTTPTSINIPVDTLADVTDGDTSSVANLLAPGGRGRGRRDAERSGG